MRILAGKTTDFLEGTMGVIWVGKHSLAIARVNGELRAFAGECPHRGAQLAQGRLIGPHLTCPWHEWKFDVLTGEGLTNPHARLNLFPISIEGQNVFVEVPDDWGV